MVKVTADATVAVIKIAPPQKRARDAFWYVFNVIVRAFSVLPQSHAETGNHPHEAL